MFRAWRIVAVLALLLPGCAFTTANVVRSASNDAAFYNARYLDRCVTNRVDAAVPCERWTVAQQRLNTAAVEAGDALKVGGKQRLQIAALKRNLKSIRKEFGPWAEK